MSKLSQWARSDLTQKISATFGTQVLRLLLSFGASVAIARLLGPTNRGYFALASATGALGVQFANLGLHTSNTYFAARHPESLSSLVGNTLAVSFGFGTIVSLGLWCATLYTDIIGLRGGILTLALIWIPIGLAYLLGQNLLLGIQQIKAFNSAEIISKALPLILISFFAVLHFRSAEAMLSTMLIGLAASSCYVFIRLLQQLNSPPTISMMLVREHLGYATRAYLAGLFCFLVVRSDLFLVQKIVGVRQAGYYSIAVALTDTLSLLPTSVATILFPRLSGAGDLGSKLGLTWRAAFSTAVIMAPVLFISGLLSRLIIVFLFGRAFEQSWLAFVLLLPGVFFLGMHSVIVQLLNGIGYPVSVVYIWGFCFVLNLSANWFVIPRFGIAGASVTSSISYLFAFVLVTLVILRVRQTSELTTVPREITLA